MMKRNDRRRISRKPSTFFLPTSMAPSDCMVRQVPARKRLYTCKRFRHTAKAKMPVRPRVWVTMVLAEPKRRVRLMEATAKGAPCEMMLPQAGPGWWKRSLRWLSLYNK